MAVTDYSGTADLARRRYELAKGRSESNLAQQLGQVGQQYYGLARQQEAGLESRGILRSGEANRRRVELGAEEKARRLALSQQAEQDIQSAALDYASVLAELQAKGATGTTTPTPAPAPAPAPGTPGTQPPADQKPPADQGTQTPSTQCQPGFAWDPIQNACVPIAQLPTVDGKPVMPGDTPSETRGVPPTIIPAPSPLPVTRPVVGGINEVGSGGREIGVAPKPAATTPIATPAPNGQVTIGGVTAPASQWNAAFAALAAAAARNQTPATSVGTVNPRLR